jgi:citrate synthase
MSWCKWLGIAEQQSVETLLDTLSWCNQSAALTNNNASSAALTNAAGCDSRFEHAVASALLTFGTKHGPTTEARRLLYDTENEEIITRLEDGEILPGWGNAFYKKSIDPAFVPLDHLLRETYSSHHDRLDEIATLVFKVRGRVLYPNAASYNAICAEIVCFAWGLEIMLPIMCRLPAWGKQFLGAQG